MSCCPPGSHGYLASQHDDEGRTTAVGDVSVYEVGDMKDGKMVLVIPDVWGWDSGRLRAICDELARKEGMFCVVPKILPPFEGGTKDDGLPPDFNLARFGELVPHLAASWAPEHALPKIDTVLRGYKAKGAEKVGIISFCYGGWIGFHLTRSETALPIVAAVGAHPSLKLEQFILQKDPAALAEGVRTPWLLMPAGVAGAEGGDDQYYDADGALFTKLEEQLPGQNVTTRFADVAHGFVTRGAIKNGTAVNGAMEEDAVQAAVSKAVQGTVAFLKKNGL